MPMAAATAASVSVRTGTTMQGSNLGYQTWAVAIYLLTTSLKGVSSMNRDLGAEVRVASGAPYPARWDAAEDAPFAGRGG